jgi:ribosomal protein S14
MTSKYGDLFAGYETTLMNHFKKEGKNSEAEMNKMRTQFANKISTDAAGMRPDVFCLNHVPRIQQAVTMSRQQFRQWASTPYVSHPVSRPLCAGN